jgi:hypothetical protein
LAGLAIDLRATAHNGNALVVGETSHFIPGVGLGDTISFDIFVIATGTNANLLDDKFVALRGSVWSDAINPLANLQGTLKLDLVRTTYDDNGEPTSLGFDGAGASVGTQQDLDADGDLDVGSNVLDNGAQNYWSARFAAGPPGVVAPPPNGRKIGFGTFTVTSVPNASSTLLHFHGSDKPPATSFLQDGVLSQGPSYTTPPENGILIQGVPEPTSLGVISLIGLCALRRRR